VDTSSPLFVTLHLTGVFAFALNGALTAIRVARLDIVGVMTLGEGAQARRVERPGDLP
jgi:uncharacterized membrane protein YeiH